MRSAYVRRFPLRAALSASAAIAVVVGLAVGVQLASSGGQSRNGTVDRGGNPLPTEDQLGGDQPPMDGIPASVIISTVRSGGSITVKTITVSRSSIPTTTEAGRPKPDGPDGPRPTSPAESSTATSQTSTAAPTTTTTSTTSAPPVSPK